MALAAFLVYNVNLRIIGAGDTYPARALPFGILEHRSLYLDPIAELVRAGNPSPYWMRPAVGGRRASHYPIAIPVLITPLYVPVVLGLHWSGAADTTRADAMLWMEKLVAAAIAAAASAWFYLLALRRVRHGVALAVTIAFAFGTNTWVTGSQALWQHGMGELLVIALLWFASSPPAGKYLWAAGLCCGLLVANRSPDALLALPFGVALLWRDGWRSVLPLAAAAALPIGLTAAYNETMFGHLAGGYSHIDLPSFLRSSPIGFGIAGLLLSPGKGLLIFAPFLWLTLIGLRRWWSREQALDVACVAGIALQLVLYAGTDWRAGYSFGPRFLTDSLPLWSWLLLPVMARARRPLWALFWAGTSFAIAVQAEAAFCYRGFSDGLMYADDGTTRSYAAAWKVRNTPLLVEPMQRLAPSNLPGLPTHPYPERLYAPTSSQ